MLVLGIESSCDETGAALVRDGRYLLSNVVASQIEIHNRYGGVVPEVASRQQLATILPVIETTLEQASCSWKEIDAVAATYGPGLAGSRGEGATAPAAQAAGGVMALNGFQGFPPRSRRPITRWRLSWLRYFVLVD